MANWTIKSFLHSADIAFFYLSHLATNSMLKKSWKQTRRSLIVGIFLSSRFNKLVLRVDMRRGRKLSSGASIVLSRTTMSELPEELLQTLIEILAYNFDFIERHDPQFRWKCARTELVSLSVVNRRLRRLCLPFLFAYIEIQSKDLEDFSTQCAASDAFALSVRYIYQNICKVVGS